MQRDRSGTYHAGVPGRSSLPRSAGRSTWNLLIGQPLRSSEASKEQITPVEGLSALSLDALTSVAYGPEAIIVVLALAGAGALHLVLPITVAIVVLLAILVFSYRQVIDAYPGGGGAYAVSRANLGAGASLVAGASLIVDYTLTVAVSIAAGVGALTSAFPSLTSATVPICLGILAVITLLNLRGLGETARAFLLPTMLFIVGLLAIIAVGLIHPLALHASPAGSIAAHHPRAPNRQRATGAQGVLRRLQRPHRSRGHRQRRPALQATSGGSGQANRAAPGSDPRHHAPGSRRAGPALAHRPAIEPDGTESDHGHRGRKALGLLHRLAHHHRRAGVGRQHVIRGPPDPGQPAGPGTTTCPICSPCGEIARSSPTASGCWRFSPAPCWSPSAATPTS